MEILNNPESFSPEEVLKLLSSSKNGLSLEEVLKRQEIFGKNVIKEEKINFIKIFFRQFSNILIYVLFAAALISLLAGKWIDFGVISIMILINSFMGFWQEVKAEVSLKELKKLTESKEKVIRNNEVMSISSSELVPGDIVLLFEGSIVTSDIRLLESSGLMVDEASLTGESMPVAKDHTVILPEKTFEYDQLNMAFSGTSIVKGTAMGVVVKTASSTYLSTIASKAKESSPESPLSRALKYFSKYHLIFLILIFLVLGFYGYFQGRNALDMANILIAQLVSAVPEGLPLVISLVMIVGALALSKKKTLVRYLPSVETLGSATVIASDKTGTITEGKIEVHKVFSLNDEALKLVAFLCNDAYEGSGDPIDVALEKWTKDLAFKKEAYPRIWSLGFDIKRRMMATAHEFDGKPKILVKGAYESLKTIAKNKADFDELEKNLDDMSLEGLRVLSFGIGNFENKVLEELKIDIVGLIGFLDPPKANVKQSVESAQKAGIKVIMITGDYPLTAKAIAKQVSIYKDSDGLLTEEHINSMSSLELYNALKKTSVLARILPEHKYKIVKTLQEHGEVVAVSGDGVNDVPALKIADLGIAMGSGSEVAKSVSKMIILDNNLSVIVEAIKTGRIIADNIRKVIYYLISTSFQEIFFVSVSIIADLPLPLYPVQILWINLVTDGVQDKTFAFAKEEGNVMHRHPKKPSEQFFDFRQIVRILTFGLAMGWLFFELYKHLLVRYSYEMAASISFTSVVTSQWLNGIQAQQDKIPFFKNIKKALSINPYIFLGIGFGVILQLIAIYVVPYFFHSVPIGLNEWKYPLFTSFCAFFVVEIRKWIELAYDKIKKHRKKT